MLAKRIIPCLDVAAGRVVKGVSFVELRDAGDPVEIARRYDEQGADDIRLVAGGVIPQEDIPALEQVGVSRVFVSGTHVSEIADYIGSIKNRT